MPKHVFHGRLPRPAPPLRPLALTTLIAASAIGTATILSPPAAPPQLAAGVDPIALWLGTAPGDRGTEGAADLPAAVAQNAHPDGASAAVSAARSTAPGLGTASEDQAVETPEMLAEGTVAGPLKPAESSGDAAVVDPTQQDRAGAAQGERAEAKVAAAPQDAGRDDEPPHAVPSRWRERTVGKGETLAQVLKAFGVDKDDRAKVVAAAKGTPALAKLKVGQKIRGRVDGDGGLLELQLILDAKSSVHLELADDDFRVHTIDRPVEKRLAQASSVIQSSLFVDGQEAGLSDAQIMELAAIFGWEVDFALGLRPGDRFSLIYEAEYLDGQKVDNGAILAAEFVNQGQRYRAVRFEDDDGTLGYYAPDGTSKKQAFLRTPLKLARVSSGFSLSRMHPILNTRRAHKGVDYSAPVGTPVKATGSGLVAFSGQKNGYGNVIELQHGEKYSTLYGHLSRFAEGMRVGEHVKQGQVIGYVGQTGLATGPHLHYEFRVAGEYRDPLSTKLPTAEKLDGQDFATFRKKAAPLLAQLDRMDRTMLARAP